MSGQILAQDEPLEAPEVLVEGSRSEAITSRPLEEAREELRSVPGGTTLIDAEEFRAGPTGNLQDVLEFAPGVYGQNTFGGDENRLSIRGSGISQDFAVKGIRLLRDGLPISEADGDFHSQLVDPLIARYVEVYRGANALQYGASTLGGAINFVSYTGYTASPLTARLELGSDSFIRPQLSGGQVLGDSGLDVFASLSGTYYDGFRDHAETRSTRFYGNLGYRHSGRAESRVHVSVQDNNQELPGSLTKAQLKNDPTQASGFFKAFNSQNDFDRYRIDFQHTIRSRENDRLDFGVFYETQDIFHPLPFFVINEDQNNYGLSLRQELHGRLGARNSRLVWGGTLALGATKIDEFEPLGGGARGALNVMEDSDVLTSDVFAEGQLQVAESLTVILGAQLAYSERETDFNRPDPAMSTSIDKDYFGFSPKLGLLWQAADSVQVFGNVSRSFEPPIILDFNNTTLGVLDEQTATTVEVGARGGWGRFNFDLAFYHSWIDDEILSVEIPPLPSGNFTTSNADKTTHSGIELGVDALLPLNWLANDRLRVRAAYTYGRFRFDNDRSFGDNDIPGIPEHFGRVELLYEHPSGFYIGPKLEAANSYFVDFTNTLETDSYTIFGLRAGYVNRRGLSVYIEARNLEDEAYASNTGIAANASGMDRALFNPGIDRSLFAGIEWKLE